MEGKTHTHTHTHANTHIHTHTHTHTRIHSMNGGKKMLWKILVQQIQKSITTSKESAVVFFDHNDDYFIQCNN